MIGSPSAFFCELGCKFPLPLPFLPSLLLALVLKTLYYSYLLIYSLFYRCVSYLLFFSFSSSFFLFINLFYLVAFSFLFSFLVCCFFFFLVVVIIIFTDVDKLSCFIIINNILILLFWINKAKLTLISYISVKLNLFDAYTIILLLCFTLYTNRIYFMILLFYFLCATYYFFLVPFVQKLSHVKNKIYNTYLRLKCIKR